MLYNTLSPAGVRGALVLCPPWCVVALSGKSIFRSGTVVLSALIVVLVLAMALLPAATMAATHPKTVWGYVYDQDGRKVADAQVTVTMKNVSTNATVSTKTDTSDSVGFYSCNFGLADWNIGDKIVVTATYKSLQATNSTVVLCNNEFFQWENVTFPYEIPELGNGLIGILVTGLILGAVAVAVLVFWRRKA